MKLFSFLWQNSRGTVVSAVLVGILGGAASSGLIILVHVVLNRGEAASAALIWSFVGLCILLPVSRILSEMLLVVLAQKTIYDLRVRLSRQIMNTPLRRLQEIGTARIFAALTEDILTISTGFASVPNLFLQTAILAGCLAYLAWLSVPVFFGVLVFLILGMFSVQMGFNKGFRFLARARELQDHVVTHIKALVEGTKEFKLHQARREAFLADCLQPTADQYRRQNIIGNGFIIATASWGQVLFFIQMGLLIFILPAIHYLSKDGLTGYALTVLYMMVPIGVIGSVIPNLGRASISLRKVESLDLTLGEAREAEGSIDTQPQSTLANLELVGVSHTYNGDNDGSKFTLGPIDLTLNSGDLVFLTGGNGSGKTTLALLLTGLYSPESGEVRLNGVPINDSNRGYYRQHFSAVFSDFYLLETLFGLQDDDLDRKAGDYLKQLHLDHKVQIRNGNLSTIELSHGQRKRLALLTAYLEDRPIYVFDEWAADQDPTFKQLFYHKLLPELKAKGKTVLVISHDDHYYNVADRIIKLDYGKIDYDTRNVASRDFRTELADKGLFVGQS